MDMVWVGVRDFKSCSRQPPRPKENACHHIKDIDPVAGEACDTVGPFRSRFGLCSKRASSKTGLPYA